MKRILLLLAVIFCCAAHSEITQVDGRTVTIRLNGKTVSVGERLDVFDASGTRKGVIKILRIFAASASAEIESGQVFPGMKVARRAGVKNETVKADVLSHHFFDFRLNPIGLISGGIDANLDFRITENLTLGLQGLYLHVKLSPSGIFTSDYDITAYGYGARANWFFDGVFHDGFYFGPSLEYLSVTLKTTDVYGAAQGTASGVMASALMGYGWFWENFNIMLGGGYGAVLGASGITIKDARGNQQIITANLSGLTYELSIGWAL